MTAQNLSVTLHPAKVYTRKWLRCSHGVSKYSADLKEFMDTQVLSVSVCIGPAHFRMLIKRSLSAPLGPIPPSTRCDEIYDPTGNQTDKAWHSPSHHMIPRTSRHTVRMVPHPPEPIVTVHCVRFDLIDPRAGNRRITHRGIADEIDFENSAPSNSNRRPT
jgi:hypothetical protein